MSFIRTNRRRPLLGVIAILAAIVGTPSVGLAQVEEVVFPFADLDLGSSNLSLPKYNWNYFLGANFGASGSIGGISGAPNTEIFPGVTADTRSGLKISADVSGRAGLDLKAGIDLGGFNSNAQMLFGPTLTKPSELQVGRAYRLETGGTIDSSSNLSISLPTVSASADAILQLDVDGRVDYGLFPIVPYDFDLFNFNWDFDLDLFDFNFDLNLPDLPDFSFLGVNLPDFPDFPAGEPGDALIRLKLPPSDPQLSLGEVQVVNPAKSFDVPEASFDGDTARFSVEGDLLRIGADLDGIVTAATTGTAILGTSVDVGKVAKISYDLVDFKYGPELGFKYDAAITPDLLATLHFDHDILADTGQGFERTDELHVTWGDEFPEIVLIGDEDVNVDVNFDGVNILLDHRGAFTLEDYLEIRALRLSAKLKGKFVNIPLGQLGPLIDERYSPLGDLFGELEFPVFDSTELLGTVPVPAAWQNYSFTLNAAPVVFAYAADTTGPLDAAADWLKLADHTPLGGAELSGATLVVASGDANSDDLADLQPIDYTDAPNMITETYVVSVGGFPFQVPVTHQDFDRIVQLQGLRVPQGASYTIPINTVRRLNLVNLQNDGVVQNSGFFELTSPGVFTTISGQGTIDLERAASIDVDSLLVDAGQTMHFSNAGTFHIDVQAVVAGSLRQLDSFEREGFSVDVANTFDMGGELLVDNHTILPVTAGQRMNVGPGGIMRASGNSIIYVDTPLLVNEGLVESEDNSGVVFHLTGNSPTIEGAEGSSFQVGAGTMTVDATQSFEIAARNTRFHVEDGGILRFIDRVGVDNGTRFDVEIDDGGYAELRGVRNYNETEGFVSIINHGLLELTKSTTSVRPQPPGFLSTDENQFTPTDLINDGTIRVIGDQTPDTVTKLQFNATITNYVGGGVALAQGRWELLGAPIEYHNTPDIAEFLENTGIAIINTNVTDVMWSDRIVNDVGLDYTAPNTELWYNDAEVVFSGAARWDYFDTLRENRNVLEFRDHHHFHTVGDFANSGDLTVDNDSELDVNGTFTNRGGTAIFSGGSTLNATGGVVVEGGLVRIEADSLVTGVTFEGESDALIPANTTWVIRDVFDPGDPDNGIPPTVQSAALELAGRRVLVNFGDVVLEGEQASFEAMQSLEINAGPLLVSAGNHLTITPENEDGVLQPVLINDGIGSGFYGRLEVATGGSLTVDAVDGIESWAGDVIVGGGSYLFAPKVNFLAELNGQPLPFPGSFHVDGEAATDLVNIAPHITLSGDGIIRGLSGADTMVMVDGTLSPGSSTGSLEIQGDYSQTANADMRFEVSGFGDTSADQLLVSGEAVLDGTLDLSIVDGYGLETGQQFTIVSAGELVNNGLALSGSGLSHFAVTIEPGANGSIVLEYLGGSFILPGDYNGDHVVDAADYTLWRNHLGEAITLPNEDPNTTPGQVTQEDYEIWRSYYGESSSSTNGVGAVNVPEPAAALILLIGLATMLVGRRSLV